MKEKASVVQYKYESKYTPMNGTFKWNEEYQVDYLGNGEMFKSVDSKMGDRIINVSKGERFTIKTEMKFTGIYVIEETEILGTGIVAKLIMERTSFS